MKLQKSTDEVFIHPIVKGDFIETFSGTSFEVIAVHPKDTKRGIEESYTVNFLGKPITLNRSDVKLCNNKRI